MVSQSAAVPLCFLPARILDIWRPRLNAWLKSNLVWNSETKGNHDSTTMGIKMIIPITYSYARPSSLIESQNPMRLNNDLHAWPILTKR